MNRQPTHYHIPRQTGKQKKAQALWKRLGDYLIAMRAGRRCEVMAEPRCRNREGAGNPKLLTRHHIILRGRGRVDTAGNCAVACELCHDHTKYGAGTPMPIASLQELIRQKNARFGISDHLDGKHVPKDYYDE